MSELLLGMIQLNDDTRLTSKRFVMLAIAEVQNLQRTRDGPAFPLSSAAGEAADTEWRRYEADKARILCAQFRRLEGKGEWSHFDNIIKLKMAWRALHADAQQHVEDDMDLLSPRLKARIAAEE